MTFSNQEKNQYWNVIDRKAAQYIREPWIGVVKNDGDERVGTGRASICYLYIKGVEIKDQTWTYLEMSFMGMW